MARITDEMLMAYADGAALPKEEAEAIERALDSGDTEVRKSIETFREASHLLREAFAQDAHEPMSDTLIQTVIGTSRPVSSDRKRLPPVRRRAFAPYAMAMAASVAAIAVVGGLIGSLTKPQVTIADQFKAGPVAPDSVLATLLATKPSSVPLPAEDGTGAQVMVVGTFLDKHNRACREAELMDSTLAPQQIAIACRSSNGWRIEGIAKIAGGPSAQSYDPGYTPAGATEADALKGLQLMIGAKEPMSPEEERRLMENGWAP